ncbi:MAG: TIR domain-containing protein [Candidatus Dadabacteria bacterium]|nr:TIR domain-containing protein [Candidatus Dadabacteria bacterium]
MSKHRIHVFISHSWSYSDHYETLRRWIFQGKWRFGQASLTFLNFSVPRDNPIHKPANAKALREAIYRRIERSHVVVIPLGMYASYSHWIEKEIRGAKLKSKPILGVNPWGQQRKSSVVGGAARNIVGWNKKSILGGIWELYHNE